jgi:signal transduction histidine kinase
VTAAADRERLALLVHEVRSPVAAIAAISEALSDDRLEESAMRELLGLAVAACRGIERVVGDAALGSIHVQAMDPGRLVRDAVSAAALGGARVRAEIQTGLPQLDADPQRLRQALDNLIANALIHSSSKDEVVVRAGADDQTVFLTVSDTGKGIPLGEQSRIFDPGVR